ncbi:MAG: hypothetical protein NUW01_18435 [Gemmatimonadaceae bacterium]|nr:hypothetical protein [Gemmatimonadaceae bacterium]
MRITNRYDLPASYVRAVSVQRVAKPYTISVTQLIKPPQMLALELAHADEIVKDAADFIDMFFGTAVHHLLDHFGGPDAESEKVLVWEQDGWTIHGTPDHAEWLDLGEDALLTDWKTTKVRALAYDKPEWEQQVNLYVHLLRLNDVSVSACQVWAFLKDWDKTKLGSDPEYPRAPLCLVLVPLWDAMTAHEFMLERLRLHAAALAEGAYGPCAPEERWQRSTWAVWSENGKPQTRAARVLATEDEAEKWVEAASGEYRIEERHGEPLRCQSYCDAAAFCGQWGSERLQEAAAGVA